MRDANAGPRSFGATHRERARSRVHLASCVEAALIVLSIAASAHAQGTPAQSATHASGAATSNGAPSTPTASGASSTTLGGNTGSTTDALPAEPPPEYRVLADRALAESAAGRWSEAHALFLRAHALYPNARSARAIGMTSYELRDYPEAYRALLESLAETRRPLDDTQRAQVEALVGEVIAFLGRYTLESMPEGAVYRVDGEIVEPSANGLLILRMGRHDVQVETPGGVAVGSWNVAGGELEALPLDLGGGPPRASSGARAAWAPGSASGGASDAPTGGGRVARRVLLMGGAGLATVGAVVLGLGIRDRNAVEDVPMGTAWTEVEQSYQRAPRRIAIGTSLLAAGAASMGIGFVLALRGRVRHDAVHASLAPQNLQLKVLW